MTTFRVRPTNRMIMIQTDKPVYKPGQTSENRSILELDHAMTFLFSSWSSHCVDVVAFDRSFGQSDCSNSGEPEGDLILV